jgi:hypothetical protein
MDVFYFDPLQHSIEEASEAVKLDLNPKPAPSKPSGKNPLYFQACRQFGSVEARSMLPFAVPKTEASHRE